MTVSQIALQAGIGNAENYIDASVLGTEEDLRDAALKYTVFGRITPEQKQQLVRALKQAGFIICSLFLSDLFAVGRMSGKCIMLFVVFAIVTEPVLRYGTMLVEKIGGFFIEKQ